MKFTRIHWIGFIAGMIIFIIDFALLKDQKAFYFIIGIAVVIISMPFAITNVIESEKTKEKDEMFLEFSRNLVESVQSGTPISKSIINLKNKNYSSLSPHIEKLANQISIGIPVKDALEIFAEDINSKTITRAITLIREAEKAGGNIEDILESVATSVSEIEKLKKERRAVISSLVVQGYIIFLIFLVIMLVMEFKILPMTSGITEGGTREDIIGIGMGSAKQFSAEELSNPFLFLLLAQGFFAGLVIGKLAEGSVKAGIKHSFILVVISLLISTGSKVLF